MGNLTGKQRKLLERVMGGRSDANIPFTGLCTLLERLGFELVRIEGSHHIFSNEDVPGLITLTEDKGKAKKYQVKEVRDLLKRYKIAK